MIDNFTTTFITSTTLTDLERAFNTIRAKRPTLDMLMNYAQGPQPLKYSTSRLATAFGNITATFTVNWMSLVIDATLDRIQLSGFDTDDKTANERLDAIFERLHLDIEADKAHGAALTTSQSYIIAWKGDDGEIECYANDPRLCAVFYDPEHPRKKVYAAKWFNRSDETQEITLYYEDRLEHWGSQKTTSGIDKASAFTLESVEPNTYGVIPVFELKSPGEIYKVLTLQDSINKLFADMMVAAEFGAFVQRWVISQSDPGALKNAPNEIWWIPSSDNQGQASSVGQFSPTDLNNYLLAMSELASAIAIITRTPKHFLMTTGANVSGEALLALENPLTRKAEKRQREFATTWMDVATFLAKLDGVEIKPSDVNVIWEKIESTQPKTEAETNQILINMGIPLVTVLRDAGWSQDDIDSMMEDQEQMKKAQDTVAQAVLAELRTRQNQLNAPQDNLNTGVANV